LRRIVETLIAFTLLGAIIWMVGGPRRILDVFSGARLLFVILAFLTSTVDRMLMSFKWSLLLREHREELGLLRSTRLYCASMVWGMFLPSTLGADFIRLILGKRAGLKGSVTAASIAIERMVGFFVALVFGLAGLFLLSQLVELDGRFETIWRFAGLTLAAGIVLFSLSFSRALFDWIWKRIPRPARLARLAEKLKNLHEAYVGYRAQKGPMLAFAGLTFAEQLVTVVYIWLLAQALNVEVRLLFVVGVVPLTLLIARLPISLDGIGVFEGVFVALMGLAGVPGAEAVSVALLGRVVQVGSWLPWWAAYLFKEGHSWRLSKSSLE